MALKVYGITICNARHIVAASSQKEAAPLLDISARHLGLYGCPTGNEEEIAAALSKPRTVFHRLPNDYSGPFIEGRYRGRG